MKEVRFFYQPDPFCGELPKEETHHAVRVLRLNMGDEIVLCDGQGNFFKATITEISNHRCCYSILEQQPQKPEWKGQIHLALAPTKNMDRMEWFIEKATEIGFDCCSFLNCKFSERTTIKTERLEKIVVSAIKQSHKAYKPELEEIQQFSHFIQRTDLPEQRYIAHCYEIEDVGGTEKPFLNDILQNNQPAVVLVGPEGDFSIDEVKLAQTQGFRSVSLGTSRLRTETAALVAVHLMRVHNII